MPDKVLEKYILIASRFCWSALLSFCLTSMALIKYINLQPRSQSSSAISDVTSPVKLVGKIRYRARFQASSGHSDSANRPGYEADKFYTMTTRFQGNRAITALNDVWKRGSRKTKRGGKGDSRPLSACCVKMKKTTRWG